nr:MAG TPA: hypothetical protein [Caudoviricetes sp.]
MYPGSIPPTSVGGFSDRRANGRYGISSGGAKRRREFFINFLYSLKCYHLTGL